MTNSDILSKIRAEIERQSKSIENATGDFAEGRRLEQRVILSFLDTLEGPTCKTCGFYENNCPYIRGKFIPYANKVCDDYTFSALKAKKEPIIVDLDEAAREWILAHNNGERLHIMDAFKAGAWCIAKHFVDVDEMIQYRMFIKLFAYADEFPKDVDPNTGEPFCK